MKEDIKYPYIARNESSVEMLVFSESKAIILSVINKGILHDVHPAFSKNYKNITTEYLSNTYGKVESKEHAEFIAKLCESNGIELFNNYDEGITQFAINRGELIFTYVKPVISDHDKQITIPLPPKEVKEMKNNGDNLVLGCEESKCEDWPKVGDEVLFPSGNGILAIKKPGDNGVVIVECNDEGCGRVYKRVSLSALQKPKTPEEELRDDIIELTLSHMENKSHPIEANAYYLFSDLLSKYNITKKPQ
tara:strand:- start:2091 stop:2837 length:747 start_codon:yes stop_codon:yes gene_type:complete